MKKFCSFCKKEFEAKKNSQTLCSLSCAARKRVALKKSEREKAKSKQCAKCGETKLYAEFAIKDASRCLYSFECKVCHRKYRNEFYNKNRRTEILRISASKKAKKEWINSIKDGLKCARCGESSNSVLQFHHTDPKTKEFEISSAASLGLSKEKIIKEIDKCEVLCANCHFKEHAA